MSSIRETAEKIIQHKMVFKDGDGALLDAIESALKAERERAATMVDRVDSMSLNQRGFYEVMHEIATAIRTEGD